MTLAVQATPVLGMINSCASLPAATSAANEAVPLE